MIISVSRWVSGNKSFIKIDSDESLGSLSVEHFVRADNKRKSVFFDLSYEGNSIWSYSFASEDDYLSSFNIFENGVLKVSYDLGEDDFSQDFYISPKTEQIPKDAIENRSINTYKYRLWLENPWVNANDQKINSTNGIPYGFNAGRFVFEIPNSRVFINAFNPEKVDRASINDKLSDAVALFEGDCGKSYLVEDDNKVVIPLSDRNRTWTEEYDYSSWYSSINVDYSSQDARSLEMQSVTYPELTLMGKMDQQLGSLVTYSGYREQDVPPIFSTELRDFERLEKYRVRTFEVPVFNFGDNRHDDQLIRNNLWGIIYGWKTFPGYEQNIIKK